MNKFRIKEIIIDITPVDRDGETLLVARNTDGNCSMSIKSRSRENINVGGFGNERPLCNEERNEIIKILNIDDNALPRIDLHVMALLADKLTNKRTDINKIIQNR